MSAKINNAMHHCIVDFDFATLNYQQFLPIGESGCTVNIICNAEVMNKFALSLHPMGVERVTE